MRLNALNISVLQRININYCWLIIGVSIILRLSWMSLNGLLVEEAYYWNYAQHLDFSYYDHPPMVAVLIKLSTLLFGLNEFSVHFPAFFCWVLTAIFVFKLTDLVEAGAGLYAVMLYAVLPYFFIQSNVITPDTPVMVCWSAVLYYLYRSLVLNESRCWYLAGVYLGLGLLSKYTIILLAPSALVYSMITPSARQWFTRKEPYIALCIVVLLFTPVIYWNATHEWASFIFQSVRRFKSPSTCSLYLFIGFLFLFLTPLGLCGLWEMFQWKTLEELTQTKTLRFFQLFTLLPLGFFCVYSLNHVVKFDWIGPGLLALLPWIALLLIKKNNKHTLMRLWLNAASVLLFIYAVVMSVTTMGLSRWVHEKFLHHYFSWAELARDLNGIAQNIEVETNQAPIFSMLDTYHIGSELAFYQTLLRQQGKILKNYPIVGNQIFGGNSLMYKYWVNGKNLSGQTLILVTDHATDFNYGYIGMYTTEKSPVQIIWSKSQRGGKKLIPFYYKIVEVKKNAPLFS